MISRKTIERIILEINAGFNGSTLGLISTSYVHELGHALTITLFGGEVESIGLANVIMKKPPPVSTFPIVSAAGHITTYLATGIPLAYLSRKVEERNHKYISKFLRYASFSAPISVIYEAVGHLVDKANFLYSDIGSIIRYTKSNPEITCASAIIISLLGGYGLYKISKPNTKNSQRVLYEHINLEHSKVSEDYSHQYSFLQSSYLRLI